jgi:hypothetical protein
MPEDMVEAAATIIFCSKRVDVEELGDVRRAAAARLPRLTRAAFLRSQANWAPSSAKSGR